MFTQLKCAKAHSRDPEVSHATAIRMTLTCLIFGHRRSRSWATFDEKHRHYLSACKRCCTPMIRGDDGTWRAVQPPRAGKLVPVERSESASARRSDGETPVGPSATPDSPDRADPGTPEDGDQPVELSTS